MVQKSFFNSKSEFSKSRISHGGDACGRRKVFRPLDRKRALHITLKSSHAKGRLSLLAPRLVVASVINEQAVKSQVTLHRIENMGNHIHMLVSFKSRELMQRFLRVVTGLIARAVTGARKGKAFGKRFWDHLAHTRIVTSRKDFVKLTNYFDKNEVEREVGPCARQTLEEYESILNEARRRNVEFEQAAAERAHRLRRKLGVT